MAKEAALNNPMQLWVEPLIKLLYRFISTQGILYWPRRLSKDHEVSYQDLHPDGGGKGLTLQYPSPLLSSTFLAILLSVLWPDPVAKAAALPLSRRMDEAATDRIDLPETIFV
jgi:hypothetical protein